MSNELTLNPSGTDGCSPDQDPWGPRRGRRVKIHNHSGHPQTLSDIQNGCLTKAGGPVTSINLGKDETWEGRAGAAGSRGTYQYDDGIESPTLDMRTGTIDPS